jgi:uncharacterized protein
MVRGVHRLWLVEFKFYTLFSLLFGVGFSILLSRASAKGIGFRRFFVRRAAFLFLIGAVHAVFVWQHDILGAYALCGILLLPFVSARPRTILAVAIAALLTPIVLHPLGGVPVGWLTDAQTAVRALATRGRHCDYTQDGVADILRQFQQLVRSGLGPDQRRLHLQGLWPLPARLPVRASRDLQTASAAPGLIRRIALWGLSIGLLLNFFYARVLETRTWADVRSAVSRSCH